MFYRTALVAVLLVGMALPLSAQTPVDPGWPPFPAREEITFVNTSVRGDSYEWDFDYDFVLPTVDSIEKDGVWTYQEAGEYAVRLEVCNPFGCDAVIKLIEVTDANLHIFSSGFETGNASEWSAVVP